MSLKKGSENKLCQRVRNQGQKIVWKSKASCSNQVMVSGILLQLGLLCIAETCWFTFSFVFCLQFYSNLFFPVLFQSFQALQFVFSSVISTGQLCVLYVCIRLPLLFTITSFLRYLYDLRVLTCL